MKKPLLMAISLLASLFIQAQTYSISLTNVSGSTVITCSNPSLNFIASVNYSSTVGYTWTGPATLTGSNVNIGLPGTYTVTAVGNNTTLQKVFSVSINTVAPSNATLQNTSATITCGGPRAQFIILTTPTPTVLGNNTVSLVHYVASPIGGTFTLPDNGPWAYYTMAPGIYTYVLTNTWNGCSSTKNFTVIGTGFPTYSLASPQNFMTGCGSKSFAVVNILNGNTTPVPGGPVGYTVLAPGSPSTTNAGVQASYTLTAPGIYTANVKDLTTNCISSAPFSIVSNTQSPKLAVVVPKQILDCAMPAVPLTAAGTNTNSVFVWSFPFAPNFLNNNIINVLSNTATPTNTFIANFTVTLTDTINGCKSTSVVPMYQNLYPPIAQIVATGGSSITCANPTIVLNNQSLTGIPPGAFPNAAPVVGFAWYGPAPQPSSGISSTYSAMAGGQYTLVAKDMNNGCTSQTVISISDSRVFPIVNASSKPVFCMGSSGLVTISPVITSPTVSLTYSWIVPGGGIVPGANTSTFSASLPGTYTVIVKDLSTGCVTNGSVVVNLCAGITLVEFSDDFQIFPNPGPGIFTAQLKGENKTLSFEIYNAAGRLVQKLMAASGETRIDLTNCSPGIYLVILKQNGETMLFRKIVVAGN